MKSKSFALQLFVAYTLIDQEQFMKNMMKNIIISDTLVYY